MLIEKRSSAVQILPQIQPQVDSLTMFCRTPIWILPTISGGQYHYTKEEINEFVTNPKALLALRKKNETVTNSIFSKSMYFIMVQAPLIMFHSSISTELNITKPGQVSADVGDEKSIKQRSFRREDHPFPQPWLPPTHTWSRIPRGR